MNKKFWATTFTLTGTIIGAGILGLPYVFAKSGVFIGLMWVIILGLIMMYTKLCLGEISLRTRGKHHLIGYAERYLGKFGKRVMFFAILFGVYSALLAYLIGEGQSFSKLFTGTLDYAIYFAIGFWFIMTLLLREGLKGLKKIETWGVSAIIILVLLIMAWYFPQINTVNYSYNDFSYFFLPFGVILFALLGFTSIPELRQEIKGSEKLFKRAIITGILIPIFLYLIFSFVFVGVLGKEISEVATLSFGPLVSLLGILTMLTSYFVLSFSLKDTFEYDMKLSDELSFFYVSGLPLFVYLIISAFKLLNFVEILGIGGVISGGLTGILILIIHKKAKKAGKRKSEYKIYSHKFIIWLLSLVFITGIILELFGRFLF